MREFVLTTLFGMFAVIEDDVAIEEAVAPGRVPDTTPNRSTPWWVTRTSSSVSGVFSSLHVMQSTC